jgi:hypothetical protein
MVWSIFRQSQHRFAVQKRSNSLNESSFDPVEWDTQPEIALSVHWRD